MALRKEKLESFRKSLVDQREKIAGDLRQATVDLINDEETYTDALDQAAADTDKTFNVALKNRQHDTLAQIDEALRRLESGNYGDCQQCGDAISEGRIKAFPFTTLCIECKSEMESEGLRFPGRVS